MEITIKLNDMSHRYAVYHIFNIFYTFDDIKFVEESAQFEVEIDEKIKLKNDKIERVYDFDEERNKECIKRAVFKFLEEVTGDNYPWGTLIGIRPSKIALKLLNEGKSNDEVIKYFSDKYLASIEKIQLCIDVAEKEKSFVNKKENSIAVYIGMPFCPTRCLYCSFAANPIAGCKSLVELYLESLYKEIKAISSYIDEKQLYVESVYFGGGTPTSINNEQFHETIKLVYNSFVKCRNVKEFTVECGRPDSITEEKLKSMKEYDVTRISINPQSMNDDTLKVIGRHHTVESVKEKFNLARKLGFDNINMDIILGLPNEGIDEVENTVRQIKDLSPDSLTIHGLSIKRASRLHENIVLKHEVSIAKQDELVKMYKATNNLALSIGLEPYYMYRQKNMVGNMENLGFSKPGKECIYNIEMIEERQTIIALGADAVSKVVNLETGKIKRFGNVKDVREYADRIDEMIEKKINLLDTIY